MTGCRKHSAAKRDLVQHYIYLFDNAGLEVAERCLLQAQSAEPVLWVSDSTPTAYTPTAPS